MLLKFHEKYINLLININGLPLAKSSNATLWPILCSNTINNEVYIVGAYFGYNKPQDSSFLQPLVNDLTDLINEGYIYGNDVIKIIFFNLICDAPAKSLVLCVKGHNGYNSCAKCTIKGQYIKCRMSFSSEETHPLRRDDLFLMNTYKNFQTGYSILNDIPGFLPITGTSLDYMHLVCLGVVKKLILLWTKGPFSVRLSTRQINKISHLLLLCRSTTPNDFARRPRPIKDIKQWKAVEFRNFLLYIGPIVLKHILKPDIYNHFVTLHVAITILIRPNLYQKELINFAESLLHHFVISFEILYGKQYISHNIHNFLHLCSDVKNFGPLDTFSAFRFENYMTSIKKRLRKPDKPLQQLLRRFSEIENIDFFPLKNNYITKSFVCKYLHYNGPLPDNTDNTELQYLMVFNENVSISCKGNNNNCVLLKNGLYILVLNIVQKNNTDIFLIGKKLRYVTNVYKLPCESGNLSIKVMAANNDRLFSWPITNSFCKAWKILFENNRDIYAIFPLNHTT